MKEVSLKFQAEDDKQDFLAWFLDGGGNDEFCEYFESHQSDILAMHFTNSENPEIEFKRIE